MPVRATVCFCLSAFAVCVFVCTRLCVLRAGPYIIDSFKAMLRHQNSHALVNAAFTLTTGSGGVITAARIFVGGAAASIFEATRTEAALTGSPLTQASLTVAQAALQQDITNAGPNTYYGTTDAYRRQLAAAFLYKVRPRVCVCVCVCVSV